MNPLEQSYSAFLGFATGMLKTSFYQACVQTTQKAVPGISFGALVATCNDATSETAVLTTADFMIRAGTIALGADAIGLGSFEVTKAFKAKSWSETIDCSTRALGAIACGISAIAIATISPFDPAPRYWQDWHSSMTQALFVHP